MFEGWTSPDAGKNDEYIDIGFAIFKLFVMQDDYFFFRTKFKVSSYSQKKTKD